MNRSINRRLAMTALLFSIALSSSGCVTSMLWEDHQFRAEGSVEVVTDEYGDPIYTRRSSARVWPTVGKAVATPFTIVVDLVTFGGFIWLFSQDDDDDC